MMNICPFQTKYVSRFLLLGSLILVYAGIYARTDLLGLPGQEFYFVRHGQTDHNAGLVNKEVYGDIPLNKKGVEQVMQLRSHIEQLPITKIYCSPLLRARQTMDAVTQNVQLPIVIVPNFREGSHHDWCEIQSVKNSKKQPLSRSLKKFEHRLRQGLLTVLNQKGTGLIIAHGGVYSVLCRILNIKTDSWAIKNCTIVRFYVDKNHCWAVETIFTLD